MNLNVSIAAFALANRPSGVSLGHGRTPQRHRLRHIHDPLDKPPQPGT